MKNIYLLSILFIVLLSYSCDDKKDIYFPEPIDKNVADGDDGIASEPKTKMAIEIAWDTELQEIDGFGCAFAEWSHRIYTHTKRDEVMKLLFAKEGLNLKILRGEMFPHFGNNSSKVIDFGLNRKFELNYDDPALISGFWADYNGSQCGRVVQLGQMWVTKRAKMLGATTFTFATWSPPGFMKTSGSRKGGSLKPEFYDQYAKMYLDFVEGYENTLGIKVHSISPANEPENTISDWSTTAWSAAQIGKFLNSNLIPELAARKREDIAIVYGENARWAGTKTSPNSYSYRLTKDILESEGGVLKNYKNMIAAGHGYWLSATSAYIPYDHSIVAGHKTWMTETSTPSGGSNLDVSHTEMMTWGNRMHNFLDEANINGYVWWAGARVDGNNEDLIRLDYGNNTQVPGTVYTIPRRYYAMKHYSQFILPGSRRVKAEKISTEEKGPVLPADVLVTAYKNGEEYIVVIINNSKTESFDSQIKIGGKDFNNMMSYTSTDATPYRDKKVNPSLSRARTINIPAYSMITLRGQIKAD